MSETSTQLVDPKIQRANYIEGEIVQVDWNGNPRYAYDPLTGERVAAHYSPTILVGVRDDVSGEIVCGLPAPCADAKPRMRVRVTVELLP